MNKFVLKKLLLLTIWVLLSLTLAAEAGNSGIYGTLMPAGPSFMAGDYVSYGFWSNDVEFYMFLFWLLGLGAFIFNRKAIAGYILALIVLQVGFIETVNDELLTLTGYMLLLPIEFFYLTLSFLWLKKSSNKSLC